MWGPDGKCRVPGLSTHYAIMDMLEKGRKRFLPIAFVAYMLYLKIAHSGLSMQSIAKMNKLELCTFLSEGLHCTNDAAMYHYERDYTMAVVMSIFSGFGLQPVNTENMVRPYELFFV